MVLNWLPPNDEIQDAQFLTESNLIESTYRSRKKNEIDHQKSIKFIPTEIRPNVFVNYSHFEAFFDTGRELSENSSLN